MHLKLVPERRYELGERVTVTRARPGQQSFGHAGYDPVRARKSPAAS